MPAPVISLAGFKAARATPKDPLELPDVSPIACIVRDWSEALEANGAEPSRAHLLAHLYAMASLLDVIAEADRPADAALGTSATIYEEIVRMARRVRR